MRSLRIYAFINAPKLRGPVASILGLTNILEKIELNGEAQQAVDHLKGATTKLDGIISDITKAIEKGEGN